MGPSWWLYITEGFRAAIDYFWGYLLMWLHPAGQWGRKRPVLVIPGFLTNDLFTLVLRRFLIKAGYSVYGWEMGINVGNMERFSELNQRVLQLSQRHGQPVTLIGWSLGGIYAREIAKQHPQVLRQLITLGSPFADPNAPNFAVWVFNLFSDMNKLDAGWLAQLPVPAPVPTTAFYTRSDGIVSWQACREIQEDALHHNVEVRGSHWGLPANRQVLRRVLALLNASENASD